MGLETFIAYSQKQTSSMSYDQRGKTHCGSMGRR
jgi:hypothetical protein